MSVSVEFAPAQANDGESPGTLRLSWSGSGLMDQVVESSQDLQTWTTIPVPVVVGVGGAYHADIPIHNSGAAFFRVRRSPLGLYTDN